MKDRPTPVKRRDPNAPKGAVNAAPAELRDAVNVMDDAKTLQKQSRHLVLSDILGSYTGTDSSGEPPEQDADDL